MPFGQIKWIFQHLSNAEVLLTFNVDFLITYLADRHANRKAIASIGLEQYVPWEQLRHLKAQGGEIVAVLPVYGFHHVVGAVAVRQVDEPVGHGVGAVWANEEHRRLLPVSV